MDPFLWGVATSAYQAEGGYNGPGEPETNWAGAERTGDVAPLRQAAEFWTRYEEDFARCREMGLNSFRLGIEWSRVQPGLAPSSPPAPAGFFGTNKSLSQPEPAPAFDYAALDHYATMLSACIQAGLEPVVTLHHFVHPAWLGSDPWLVRGTADQFANYVRVAVAHVNARLPRPIKWFITINEPNMLVLNSYLGRQFPAKGPIGLATMTSAYNELLRAHILTYNVLHDLYEERGWPAPQELELPR